MFCIIHINKFYSRVPCYSVENGEPALGGCGGGSYAALSSSAHLPLLFCRYMGTRRTYT